MKNLLSTSLISLFFLIGVTGTAGADSCPTPCTDCNIKGTTGVPLNVDLNGGDKIGEYSKMGSVTGTVPPGLIVMLTPPTGDTSAHGQTRNIFLSGTPTQTGVFTFGYQFEDSRVNETIKYRGFTVKVEIACLNGVALSRATMKFVSIPLDDLSITFPVEKNLSKDPGAAGDATVAGVVTNPYGVRDDVMRGIVYAYPNNPQAQTALFNVAKNYQAILANSGSAVTALQNMATAAAWGNCVRAATGDSDAIDNLLRPLMLDTYERSMAYVNALQSLQGIVTMPKVTVQCP